MIVRLLVKAFTSWQERGHPGNPVMATTPFWHRDACWIASYGTDGHRAIRQLPYHRSPSIEAPKGPMFMPDSYDCQILNQPWSEFLLSWADLKVGTWYPFSAPDSYSASVPRSARFTLDTQPPLDIKAAAVNPTCFNQISLFMCPSTTGYGRHDWRASLWEVAPQHNRRPFTERTPAEGIPGDRS